MTKLRVTNISNFLSSTLISFSNSDAFNKFQVLLHDTFPQQICQDCNRILELCHSFIAEAHESDRLFKEEELAREARVGIFETEDPWEFMYIDDEEDEKSATSLPLVEEMPDDKGKEDKAISCEVVSSTVSLSFFQCEECEINFPTEIQMWSHKENVHDLKLHCNTCNEVFYELKSWNLHLITHPQVFNCEECRMKFIKECEYKNHRMLHQIKAQNEQQRILALQGNSLPIPTISFSGPINTIRGPTMPFYRPEASGPPQPQPPSVQRTITTLQSNPEWVRPIKNVPVPNKRVDTNLVVVKLNQR